MEAIGLAFACALGEQRRFGIFLLCIKDPRVRDEHFGQVRRQRRGAIAGGESTINPFLVLLANLVVEPAKARNARVRQSKIWIELDGLFEHLQGVVNIFAARIASAAKIKIIGLRIFGRLSRDGFFFLRRKRNAQRLRDTAGNFLLNGEDVFE